MSDRSSVVTGTETQTTKHNPRLMRIKYLRLAAAKSVKFSALVLLLAIATGCNTTLNNPEVDRADVSSTSESVTADTPDIATEPRDRASSQATPNNAPEETVVVEEPNAPPSKPATSKPVARSPQSAPPADNRLVDLESGMQYADARTRLIEQGWIPAEGPDPGPYGVERMAYDAGYTEVSACAGTGMGQCRFDFVHPGEQKSLAVITYGGSKLEVGDWDIQTASPTVAEAPANSGSEVQVQSVIPMQFQGEWNMGLEGCGSLGSDGRLQIGLDRIDFYESFGNVEEVIVQGDSKMTVTVEYSSEGETFTRTSSFELSSDRSTLTHIETNTVRYRCPG